MKQLFQLVEYAEKKIDSSMSLFDAIERYAPGYTPTDDAQQLRLKMMGVGEYAQKIGLLKQKGVIVVAAEYQYNDSTAYRPILDQQYRTATRYLSMLKSKDPLIQMANAGRHSDLQRIGLVEPNHSDSFKLIFNQMNVIHKAECIASLKSMVESRKQLLLKYKGYEVGDKV